MRRSSPDFWSGLALAALGAYIVVQARGWDYLTEDGPGPGFFPLWYGIGILACSAWLVAFGKSASADWRGTGRALAAWAAIAVSVALLKLVGFALSFGALAFFIISVMYRRPPAVAALVALCAVAGFYLIFPLALGVALP
jgi:putative tricarboxylic transport membrane protein